MKTLNTIKITAATFDEDVRRSELPVLVDFTADWCPPCKMLKPVLEDVAHELADTVRVAFVDVDRETDLAGDFSIASIPSLKIFVGGTVVAESNGFKDRDTLLNWINSTLKDAA